MNGGVLKNFQGGIRASDQPLRGGFFVAGGAVDLAGEIEAADPLRFQGVNELRRRAVVVFDRVARPKDLCVLQAPNRCE